MNTLFSCWAYRRLADSPYTRWHRTTTKLFEVDLNGSEVETSGRQRPSNHILEHYLSTF